MDAMQVILSRRSIRHYTNQTITTEVIQQLLEAAMSAPSAGNEQAWQFVVITDHTVLDAIHEFHPHSDMLAEAAAAILVCGDMHLDKRGGYWVQDCSAATENILLAAHALGLGAVWMGVYPREDRVLNMKKVLALPDEITPLALVALGYPAEQLPPSQRFNPERVHHNRW
jgi:nitroreductase